MSQTTTLKVHLAFRYITLSSLHDYDMNSVLGEENRYGGRRIFLNLVGVLMNSTLGKFHLHLTY